MIASVNQSTASADVRTTTRCRTQSHTQGVLGVAVLILLGREMRDPESGAVLPFHSEPIRQGFKDEGLTPLEIFQVEQSFLDDAEANPRSVVSNCVPRDLFALKLREGREGGIFDHRVVPVPGTVMNALLCEKLLQFFPRQTVLATPGFVEEIVEFEGTVLRVVRMDLDPHLAKRGFMVPQADKDGVIVGLRIYRRPNDARPFLLRSREVALGV